MAPAKPEVKKKAVGPSPLDVFPVWAPEPALTDKEAAAASTEKYEDPAGLSLPAAAQGFMDCWKRPEELVQNVPHVPLVCVKSVLDTETKGKGKGGGMVATRELEGKLYAGHESFEWLLSVITFVMSAEKSMKKGDYLWELIWPKDKDGQPAKSPTGRYRIRLFLLDTWRAVTVDDRMPVNLFGRPLLVCARPLQLWPLLLCKAILKVMAVYCSLDCGLPHQVAAFQMLTGWPQEDLLDPLSGVPAAGGFLFDRLQDHIRIQDSPQERRAIATCCLIKRSKPERNPPTIIVMAGPSGVGRASLIKRLVGEFPDKFGLTISHTTRRPREHEVDGTHYHFTDKRSLMSAHRGRKFLEVTRVPTLRGDYWYGTSHATVREVAATGKLCVMGLDLQGAKGLATNKHIDGLYIYISTSSPDTLELRQRARLREDESTIKKRLTWAEEQLSKAQKPGLFDHVIPNTNMQEVYHSVKEAISSLSPIIRNRLRGLPAYVLDYSDLIPPNSVEKPFLKPVVIAGPNTGERAALMAMLVKEFPDVFAFPKATTTLDPNEADLYQAQEGDELMLSHEAAEPQHSAGAASQRKRDTTLTDQDPTQAPAPTVMEPHEFEAAAASGKLLEVHSDLFTHALAMHKHGITMEALAEVTQAGKLPLLELEVEGAQALRFGRSLDCLTIFLAPPSIPAYEERVRSWLTEDDATLAKRRAIAAEQLATATASGVFDQVLDNDNDLDGTYAQLKAIISKFRPDIVPAASEELDPHSEAGRAARRRMHGQPALLLCGPPGGGRELLAQRLLARCPDKVAVPPRLTDRKLAKGEAAPANLEFVKPDVLQKMAAAGQLAVSMVDEGGSTVAVAAEALTAMAMAGKMALVELATQDQAKAVLRQGLLHDPLAIFVARAAALSAGHAEAKTPEAAAAAQLAAAAAAAEAARATGMFQATITEADGDEAWAQLQEPLSTHSPGIVPPLLAPLVIASPFGSGKRAVLQQLLRMLPVLAVPRILTTRPRVDGSTGTATTDDMDVVSQEEAQSLLAHNRLLVHQQVLGHSYGITAAAVRKLQAAGRLAILDLDVVEDAVRLREAGFQATYLFLGPSSPEDLQARLTHDILSNPPLGHEPEDAVRQALAQAQQQLEAAAAQPQAFDATVTNSPEDPQATLGRLLEFLNQRYPSAVPPSTVWGFGRPLWDPTVRVYGQRPLRVVVLGPAASGKSTQCELLAARFALPHINAGDLLYKEVQAKTPLGVQAAAFMDSSKTVPDHFFLELLLHRLTQPDCVASGWLLDGFPHNKEQAAALAAAGLVPDKVLFLEATHAVLLDRTKYRRVDYQTNKVYHIPLGSTSTSASAPGPPSSAQALSPAVQPLCPDGSVDAEVLSRLEVRHDDSQQNVRNRLALWDQQQHGLREVYEDVSLRIASGSGAPKDVFDQVESFLTVEARQDAPEVLESRQLRDMKCMVVQVMRHRHKQLVKLLQVDGTTGWVEMHELASNCSCVMLHRDPTTLPHMQQLRRLDSSQVARQHLLKVESQEPVQLLVSLAMGPQHMLASTPPPSKQVVVIAGPSGAGRAKLAALLLADFPDKLSLVARHTSRPLHKAEAAAQLQLGSGRCSLQHVPERELRRAQQGGALAELSDDVGHACGTPLDGLEAAWGAGKLALVLGPVELVAALKEQGPQDMRVLSMYVGADLKILDQRMRLQGIHEEADLQLRLADANRQEQLLQQQPSLVDARVDNSGELQLCYSRLKHELARHWPPKHVQAPGLLLLQEHANGASALRLRALTCSGATLELPRGKHLLRVSCSDLLLHCATFQSATPFQLEEASKLLPALAVADGDVHVVVQEKEHDALTAGSQQLLFRFLLRPTEACSASISLRGSNAALGGCSQLMLVDNGTREGVEHVLNRLEGIELLPKDKGYTLLAWAQPHVDVPPGAWLLQVNSSKPLPPLQDLAPTRTAAFEGVYMPNSRCVVCRFVVSPQAPVSSSIYATLRPGLAFRLTLLQPPPGKDPTWGADYAVVLSCGSKQQEAAADGTASSTVLVPNVALGPGKYLLQLELVPELCELAVDPVTGAVTPAPAWTLQLTPIADEKACPIIKDESWDRHFKATIDSWQAAALNAANSAAGTAATPAAATAAKAAAAATKDRARQAQAALERHQIEVKGGPPSAGPSPRNRQSKGGPAPPPPPQQQQQQQQVQPGQQPGQQVRQLKSGDTLELHAAAHVKRVAAAAAEAHAPSQPKLLSQSDVEGRLEALQLAASQDAAVLAALSSSRDGKKAELGALQARKASEFTEWRSQRLLQQKAAADQKVEVMRTIRGSALDIKDTPST